MRLILLLRLVLMKWKLRGLLALQRVMKRDKAHLEHEYPHTTICIDTEDQNYEYHYASVLTEVQLNLKLRAILAELMCKGIFNNEVTVYRWVEEGHIEQAILQFTVSDDSG